MRIYYDSYQEGRWFASLHDQLSGVPLFPFPSASVVPSRLAEVLEYDRPDIVLTDDEGSPILVLERTIEVPSGHNVGQRFARLARAAQCGVPAVYFGPYSAFKHGGQTSGPRYMNLRLFKAIDEVMAIEGSPITMIRWPVDADFEIVHQPSKDQRLREYLVLFFELLSQGDLAFIRTSILKSQFERRQELERLAFAKAEVRRAQQYDQPPQSVWIGTVAQLPKLRDMGSPPETEVLLYTVGMRKLRSDPYTGQAILYAYLYCGGMVHRRRELVLYFPYVTKGVWNKAAAGRPRKDIRLYREVADAILFADGLVGSRHL